MVILQKKFHRLPLDMLIAAHARSEDMILVTNNVREFARVPDLVVENWAK